MSQHHNMTEMLRRLKVRLALADFKRKHGYERYDLYTLEYSLLRAKKHKRPVAKQKNHRYYPTSPITATASPRRPCKYTTPSTFLQSPLSAKRNTPPRKRLPPISSPASTATSMSSDDEDAANLLVMLHNMA